MTKDELIQKKIDKCIVSMLYIKVKDNNISDDMRNTYNRNMRELTDMLFTVNFEIPGHTTQIDKISTSNLLNKIKESKKLKNALISILDERREKFITNIILH